MICCQIGWNEFSFSRQHYILSIAHRGDVKPVSMTTAGNNEIVFYNSDDSKRRSSRRRCRERDEENQVVVSLALTPRYNSISGVVVSLLAYSHFLIQSHQHNRWLLREREKINALPLQCMVSLCADVICAEAERKRESENCLERASGRPEELLTARIIPSPRIVSRNWPTRCNSRQKNHVTPNWRYFSFKRYTSAVKRKIKQKLLFVQKFVKNLNNKN